MGSIYVVGIGPGGAEHMTKRAADVISSCDVIAGYDYYITLLGDMTEGKEVISSPMKKETERCRMALDAALDGKNVAVVSSGDAGIYGMAGIMCQICEPYPRINIEVVPGVTACCSGAAVLGAPLIHDFAVISLSDLLTPWDKIEKRLRLAADADFVICLYNPSSKKRAGYLKKACDIIGEYRQPNTQCGYVKNIGRTGEEYKILTLGELRDEQTDMFTTVFIGSERTRVINGRLVTPRGYKDI